MATKEDELIWVCNDLSSAIYNLELAGEYRLAKRVEDIEKEIKEIAGFLF